MVLIPANIPYLLPPIIVLILLGETLKILLMEILKKVMMNIHLNFLFMGLGMHNIFHPLVLKLLIGDSRNKEWK
jgi:hypothetical protein